MAPKRKLAADKAESRPKKVQKRVASPPSPVASPGPASSGPASGVGSPAASSAINKNKAPTGVPGPSPVKFEDASSPLSSARSVTRVSGISELPAAGKSSTAKSIAPSKAAQSKAPAVPTSAGPARMNLRTAAERRPAQSLRQEAEAPRPSPSKRKRGADDNNAQPSKKTRSAPKAKTAAKAAPPRSSANKRKRGAEHDAAEPPQKKRSDPKATTSVATTAAAKKKAVTTTTASNQRANARVTWAPAVPASSGINDNANAEARASRAAARSRARETAFKAAQAQKGQDQADQDASGPDADGRRRQVRARVEKAMKTKLAKKQQAENAKRRRQETLQSNDGVALATGVAIREEIPTTVAASSLTNANDVVGDVVGLLQLVEDNIEDEESIADYSGAVDDEDAVDDGVQDQDSIADNAGAVDEESDEKQDESSSESGESQIPPRVPRSPTTRGPKRTDPKRALERRYAGMDEDYDADE